MEKFASNNRIKNRMGKTANEISYAKNRNKKLHGRNRI